MDEQSLNELLECSVCLERLDHTSKVLPCQHTFCRRCLDEIYVTKRELRCPECRTLVDTRVEDLPSNILLIRLLEGIKTKNCERSRSPRQHNEHLSQGASQVKYGSQPCAKALYNYVAIDQGDLSFRKGDVILLKKQVDENWFHGELNNSQGFFPATYVQVLVPLPVTIPQCKALYDFDIEDEKERKDCLCFKKDEILTVIKQVDSNWIEGKRGEKIGIFPISFVELNDAAKALFNSKNFPNNNQHPGSGDNLPLGGSNFLHPVTLAGQLPQQKRHSFTATQQTPSHSFQQNRRSLELSSKGNLVILPSTAAPSRVRSPSPISKPVTEKTPRDLALLGSRDKSTSNTPTASIPTETDSHSKSKIFVALYNYKPQKEDEVELKKGDYYAVSETCLDGWFKGQCLKTGKSGVFPGNYVQIIRSPTAGLPANNIPNPRAKMPSSSSARQEPQSSSSRHDPQSGSCRHEPQSSVRPSSSDSSPQMSPPQGALQKKSASRPSTSPHRPSHVPPPVTPRGVDKTSVPVNQESQPKLHLVSQQNELKNVAPPRQYSAKTSITTAQNAASVAAQPNNAHSNRGVSLTFTASSSNPSNVAISSMSSASPLTSSGSKGSVVPQMPVVSSNSGATGETQFVKKEKKNKEKISLVKKLTAGKSKKSKTSGTESDDELFNHTRSGSYPSEVISSTEGQHVKTGSFDSAMYPVQQVQATKPSRPKPVHREKFRCREPYPPQGELELELKVGDIVFVTKQREDGWFKGTLQRTGKVGLFPGSFVEKAE